MADTAADVSQPWYRSLNATQWKTLFASNLGWMFDGYETFALILTVGVALRSLLDPSLYPQIPAYAGTVIAITLLGWGVGGLIGGILADYIGRRRMMIYAILAYSLLTAIPGITCVKPKAALYMFPKLDPAIYPIEDDQQFAYELLAEQKVLIVQGTGFNWPTPDHLRVVFLPNSDDLTDAMCRIATFLEHYRNRHARQAA